MVSHAVAKNHSTLEEALQVSDKMGAYRWVGCEVPLTLVGEGLQR